MMPQQPLFKQNVFTTTFKSDATACNWVEENSSMILAQVISEACLRDWWFQVQRTVHSQQDGLWLIQIIVISYGISARMNSIQTLVILGIYYDCFLVYLYLVFFLQVSSYSSPSTGRAHGFSQTLSGGPNYFHNIKTLFFFFTVVTFALMIQKQSWVNLLALFTDQDKGTYLNKQSLQFSLPYNQSKNSFT